MLDVSTVNWLNCSLFTMLFLHDNVKELLGSLQINIFSCSVGPTHKQTNKTGDIIQHTITANVKCNWDGKYCKRLT